MDFSDVRASSKMRDIVTRLATKVVNDLRPAPRIGKVYSYDPNTKTARIWFAGETTDNLLRVHVADYLIPSVTMIETFATEGYDADGNIVRVSGVPGSYYISDYILGAPLPVYQDTLGANTVNAQVLNVAGRRIYQSPLLGTGALTFSPTQNSPNDAVPRTLYLPISFVVPAGTRYAALDVSIPSVNIYGNAACFWELFYGWTNVGPWTSFGPRRAHNNAESRVPLSFATTSFFNIPLDKANGSTSVWTCVNVTTDAGSAGWQSLGAGAVAIQFFG